MSDASSPIALVGYRASGKTTLGRRLAAELGLEFVDVDEEIERIHGRTIASFFAREGEPFFRTLEAAVLAAVLARKGTVVAAGGGAVLREENRSLLRDAARVVYLNVPVRELVRRLEQCSGRPPLTGLPLAEEVEQLLATRGPRYREVAEVVVNVAEGESPDVTLRKLVELIGGRRPPRPCDTNSSGC